MIAMRKFGRYWLRGLGLSIALISSLQLWCVWQVYAYSRPQPLPDEADAAVVLGAAVWGNKPSPVFRERINHALTLYQTGRVKKIIFTGGTPKAGFATEAEVARQYAIKQGIADQDIVFETRSKDTFQNLANTRFLMKKHHLNSVIIVSDPYHMARAMNMAQDLQLNAYASHTPTSRYNNARFFVEESYSLFVYELLSAGKRIANVFA